MAGSSLWKREAGFRISARPRDSVQRRRLSLRPYLQVPKEEEDSFPAYSGGDSFRSSRRCLRGSIEPGKGWRYSDSGLWRKQRGILQKAGGASAVDLLDR